jgi:Fic-DOC domain mobile mystery protein B
MILTLTYPTGATPLDPNELDGLRHKHITTQAELNELEHANIQAGLQWLSRNRRTVVLTDAFTLELHRRLFGAVWRWGGQIRHTEKNIGVDPMQIEVQLRSCIDDARYWYEHETFSPLEAAARFHHRLTFIHPFPNGNGRHARIMADTMLEKIYRVPRIDWRSADNLQASGERRTQYIAALKAADNENYAPLLAFAGIRN